MAVDLTKPNGRVVGVDIIPAQPPKGVSTIQGNFLSPRIQAYVQEFLRNPERGRSRVQPTMSKNPDDPSAAAEGGLHNETISSEDRSYIDRERETTVKIDEVDENLDTANVSSETLGDRTVDVVLSDMSDPWQQTTGYWKRSLNDPYHRMMNTSGLSFRDHAGSMVCAAPVPPIHRLDVADLVIFAGSVQRST